MVPGYLHNLVILEMDVLGPHPIPNDADFVNVPIIYMKETSISLLYNLNLRIMKRGMTYSDQNV